MIMMKSLKSINRGGLVITIVIISLLLSPILKGQEIDSLYVHQPWKAMWIAVPGSNPTGFGVYYFRKRLQLTFIPKTYPVYVSADNRYKLFVNEKLVSLGPARGDLAHWN